MSIQSRIAGGKKRYEVEVTKHGQLVTSDLSFARFYNGATASNDVPVNVVEPRSGYCFIITTIILSGDRSIGANGAVSTLYESDVGPVDTVQERVVITEEIAKQTRMTATGLNIEVSAGKWLNLVSDDVIVRANVSGYFVVAIGG